MRVTARTIWTFARLVAQDGSEGWGEATLEGRSAEVETAIRAFALPIKLGAVPTDLVQAAAYSAVEQALWDLSARNAGRSIAELLGGARRERVPLYANINRGTTDRSPAGFAARAAEAAALGFGAIKIAPFDNMNEGYARIAAAADAIAGRAELDGHGECPDGGFHFGGAAFQAGFTPAFAAVLRDQAREGPDRASRDAHRARLDRNDA